MVEPLRSSGKLTNIIALGKGCILHQEHYLFEAHALHNSQESSVLGNRFPMYFLCVFSTVDIESCLSLRQTIQMPKKAWRNPQYHPPASSLLVLRSSKEQRTLQPLWIGTCCTVHKLCNKAGCFSMNLSAPEWHSSASWQGGTRTKAPAGVDSPGAVCWEDTQSRGRYFRHKWILVSYSFNFLLDFLFLFP